MEEVFKMAFKYGAKSQKQEDFFESKFSKVREAIEELILSDGEDTLKWERAWCNPRVPGNFCTGKPYQGIRNASYLELVALIEGYPSSQWAGKGQIKDKGGKVRAGETGWPIFVPQIGKRKNEKTGEEESFFMGWSIYEVFNVSQQDGIILPPVNEKRWDDVQNAEQIMDVAKDYIKYQEQERAYYSPRKDEIILPLREQFSSDEGFYGTAFHEIVHWTGHESRCKRFDENAVACFGSTNYSFEELVAEFGASMLKARAGVEDGIPNTAAYIKSWWSRLEKDVDELLKAYATALKAVDYVLNPPTNVLE